MNKLKDLILEILQHPAASRLGVNLQSDIEG